MLLALLCNDQDNLVTPPRSMSLTRKWLMLHVVLIVKITFLCQSLSNNEI